MAYNELLQLENPELYQCRIRKYVQGHSTMYIFVMNRENPKEDKFYFILDSVAYFSGQMFWQGADFKLAPNDRMIEIARRVERLNRYSDDELIGRPNRFKLYEIELPQDKIMILVKSAGRSEGTKIDFKG